MTNGEKLLKIFPNMEINKKMHKGIQIDFDSDWWNAEYKEPTIKNDLGVDCINRDSAIKALDYDIKCFEFKRGVSRHMDDIAKLLNTIYETQVNNIKALPSATPQEPILDKINKMKSEIADSLEFWDYSPNNNPLASDMLETITNFWGDMREVRE